MKKLVVITLLVLNINFAFGYITENVISGCATNYSNMMAVFEVNQYTCGTGYFLPANAVECQLCPSTFTCLGGTFSFDETAHQGINGPNLITQNQPNLCSTRYSVMVAVFSQNTTQHTCGSGYYMPANYDGCQLCPINSYCGGGTYAFNETVAQGAVSCASGLYAPAGMWESAQCGRILHIGDQIVYLRATKKTTPSVNVDIDNDGVADYFGNMTTLDVPMTNGTQRKLKLSYGGQTYSVYDDSVDLTGYEP